MKTFYEFKMKYNEMREIERVKLRDFLLQNGFSDVSLRGNAGKGRKKYTSGKRLSEPYDLSNWKYIEATYNNVHFFISFQPFEIDPCSHNIHSLTDRIGIYSYVGKYEVERALSNMKITDIELPLDDNKMKRLCKMLQEIAICQLELNEIYRTYNLI